MVVFPAKKIVQVTIDHLPLSEKDDVKLSAFSFTYERQLVVDRAAWLMPNMQAVTGAHYELTFDKSFMDAIAAACKAQTNHDIRDFVAGWDAIVSTMGSMDILDHVMGEHLAYVRRDYLKATCQDERFFGQPLQGTGLSFLCLSHMNIHILRTCTTG